MLVVFFFPILCKGLSKCNHPSPPQAPLDSEEQGGEEVLLFPWVATCWFIATCKAKWFAQGSDCWAGCPALPSHQVWALPSPWPPERGLSQDQSHRFLLGGPVHNVPLTPMVSWKDPDITCSEEASQVPAEQERGRLGCGLVVWTFLGTAGPPPNHRSISFCSAIGTPGVQNPQVWLDLCPTFVFPVSLLTSPPL